MVLIQLIIPFLILFSLTLRYETYHRGFTAGRNLVESTSTGCRSSGTVVGTNLRWTKVSMIVSTTTNASDTGETGTP